jgi:hypothetical protein
MEVHNQVAITGELIVEVKFANCIANIISEYIIPPVDVENLIEEFKLLRSFYIDIYKSDPEPMDFSNYVKKLLKKY